MPSAIEKLREKCLERGVNGIRNIGRMFRTYDTNRDVVLDRTELELGLQRYGLEMTRGEVDELFACLDKDGSGSVDFDELLVSLRPPMSKARLELVDKVFKKLDNSGDGKITMKDIKANYNVSETLGSQRGGADEDVLIQQFLDTFQAGSSDDEVTKEEFLNYYSGVSASVDDDETFIHMLTNDWKL